MVYKKGQAGFTLAELLVALAILGVISTFTIPKIITAQANKRYNASAKETVGMVASAFMLYQQKNTVTSSLSIADLTPYMNYVKVDTSSMADDTPMQSVGSICGGGVRCLLLHNGSLLAYSNTTVLGGTTPAHAIWFNVDPDASQSVVASAISFYLYSNGRISSKALAPSPTLINNVSDPVGPGYDPAWFSW